MLANVIELHPMELSNGVKRIFDHWFKGLLNRNELMDELVLMLMAYRRTQLRLPELGLQVLLRNDWTLWYDSDIISTTGNCPHCGRCFYDNSITLYIHQGSKVHDKYIYACSCGKFYGVYNKKDEE